MKISNKQLAPSVRDQRSYALTLRPGRNKRQAKTYHESADNYVGVITQLDATHRVILCKDALQWIIQEKRGAGRRQGNWRGKSYITCPTSLIRLCDALCGPLSCKTVAALAALAALPARPGDKP